MTRPLEAAVMSVPGVDEVQSVSSNSTTQIQITYVDGTEVQSRPPNCGSSLIWSAP